MNALIYFLEIEYYSYQIGSLDMVLIIFILQQKQNHNQFQ